jgi:MATE family multidrug resistance protein
VVGWLGVKELAAHNVIFSIATFTYMIAAGISFAGAISVGNAVGLNSRQQVLRAGTISLALVVLLMSFSSITLLIFGKQVISLYNNESEILNIAVPLLFIFVFYQLADGVQAVSIGILRGVSDVNIPTIITIIAYWVVGLPMSYVLSDLLQWGVQGAWIGLSLGLLVSAVLLTLRFYVLAGRKQLTLI